MLEEHHADANVGTNVDGDARMVASPTMGATFRDSLPPGAHVRGKEFPSAFMTNTIQLPSITHEEQQPQQQHYPRHDELLSQLQSQLQVHSGIIEEQRQVIEEQRQHIERIDRGIETLFLEQGNIIAVLNEVRAGLRSRTGAQDRADTGELDILTEQLQNVAAKANEVDCLRMQLDVMRRQLRRMERHGTPPSLSTEPSVQDHVSLPDTQPLQAPFTASTPSASEQRSLVYQSPADARLPPPARGLVAPRSSVLEPSAPNDSRTLPGFRSIDPATSGVGSWRPAGEFTPAQAPPSAPSNPTPNSGTQASGWAAVNVNQSAKRNVPTDGHPPAFDSSMSSSPKRQRLAPLMPRTSYTEQNPNGAASPYQSTTQGDSVLPRVPSLIGSQGPSMESTGSLPPPNPLRFVAFAQQGHEGPLDDSWLSERQGGGSDVHRQSRGSPRRGRGGRSRGGRKSGGGESGDQSTPEYERADWSQVAQATSGVYYQPPDNRGTIVRRGGSQIGGPSDRPPAAPSDAQAQHAATQAMTASYVADPRFMPITTTADVASSGSAPSKKTRTKPYRNAEGILIRKDGRPDMRSVSSAMNLKKVHAKKEAERFDKSRSTDNDEKEPHGTSEDILGSDHEDDMRGTSLSTPEHEHSTKQVDGAGNEEPSTQERHNENMRKIFPYGIDGGAVQSITQQYFPRPETSKSPDVKAEPVEHEHVKSGSDGGGGRSDDDKDKPLGGKSKEDLGSMPLLDGDRSMVDHNDGDIEMDGP